VTRIARRPRKEDPDPQAVPGTSAQECKGPGHALCGGRNPSRRILRLSRDPCQPGFGRVGAQRLRGTKPAVPFDPQAAGSAQSAEFGATHPAELRRAETVQNLGMLMLPGGTVCVPTTQH
jgi:hypothetical protein